MLYFKKVTVDFADGKGVEAAIRRFTTKRHFLLDLQSTAGDIGDDRLFFGIDDKDSLTITRIRSYFQRLLPKLIVRFDKEKSFTEYQIRHSVQLLFVFAVLVLAFIFDFIDTIKTGQLNSGLFFIIILSGVLIMLTRVEINAIRAALGKAVKAMDRSAVH